MSILESYPDATGNLQGVLLALVGADEVDNERESVKSVRMYNLASIASLVKWVSAHPVGLIRWSLQSNLTYHIRMLNLW